MKLVVGLGNPGRKYVETRHNVGFRVLAELADRYAADKPRKRFEGEILETAFAGERVLLLAPQTFMNKSGTSVLAARDFFKLESTDILIVCDDFHLPLGRLRARPKGTAGGQKGLADILRRLAEEEIPRLRIGIGEPPANWDVADYVLSKFRKDEQEIVDLTLQRAADATVLWAREGIEACMNEFNRDALPEP